MSVLKLKVGNEWVDVQSIKGPKGDQGDPIDVQVNGTSVVSQGVANIPIAQNNGDLGLVKITNGSYGIMRANDGYLCISSANDSHIKAGSNGSRPIVPSNQEKATFYGLAKAAGDSTQSSSANAVGTYTDDAKTAIRTMLGAGTPLDVQVNGTSIVNNGVANVPVATNNSDFGVTKVITGYGISIGNTNKNLQIDSSNSNQVKQGTSGYSPITPLKQHEAVFYGLAKLAGADMSSSSNAVGTFTSDALVKIQKMLGIYEAPWELIREDEVTNATEADVIINVDSNGNAFELTDVRGVIWFPTQNNEAKTTSGAVQFLRNETVICGCAVDTKTVAANSTLTGAYFMVEQKDGMMYHQTTGWHNRSVMGQVRMTIIEDKTTGYYPFKLKEKTEFTSIVIPRITGTLNYTIFGKRKWTL